MSLYTEYLEQIETRKEQGLHPKPIEYAELVEELIVQIKDLQHEHRAGSLDFFIYNTLPGTTSAAGVKAQFLNEIILGNSVVEEITPTFAFELLSHMKGGPSVEVLLDLVLGDDQATALSAADVLKTQVFLYEADTDRLEEAYKDGHAIATDILQSYAKAEFFTELPPVDEIIQVVTYVTAVGDVSTEVMLTPDQTASYMVSVCLSTTKSRKTYSGLSKSNIPTSASCWFPTKEQWAWVHRACPA
jgi:aconitate hydratase 2/2-methylisocitrate dehydratase